MLKRAVVLLLLIGLPYRLSFTLAQATDTPPPLTVPDLTGLGVPSASATLNAAGLRLGDITPAESGGAVNSIIAQNPAAGSATRAGETVSVTVVRPPNVRLIYDGNDITLLNMTDAELSLQRVRFSAAAATFDAARFGRFALASRYCFQAWSDPTRTAHKDVPGCTSIRTFLNTLSTDEYFWNAAGTPFTVVQDGLVRAQCPPAELLDSTLTCEVFVTEDDLSPSILFEYTQDWLLVVNPADARWLPLDRLRIAAPGVDPSDAARLDDRSQYTPLAAAADPTLLAPGQCTFYSGGSLPDDIACTVTARADVGAFWLNGFAPQDYAGTVQCPPPIADRVSLCLLGR